jgi:hypothetical protein
MTSLTQDHVRGTQTGAESSWGVGALLLIWAVLIGAALVQHGLGWDDGKRIWLLDLDVERSVYTWFSQLLLAGAGLLLLDNGARVYPRERLVGAQWLLLGLVFFALSADEALSLHELLSAPVGSALGTSGFLTFAWVLPLAALCLLGFIAFIPFLRALPGRVRATMLLAAALYLGGAIGMELIGGKLYADAQGDVTTATYRLAAIIEEALEGLGILVFIYSIGLYRAARRMTPLFG